MSLQQLRQLFSMESQDTLQQMEDSILQLEKTPNDPDAIKRLFRAAHTIKGSAGVVGLDNVSSFTHVVENLLDKVRNGQLIVDGELVRLMLACRDHIANLLDDGVENPDNPDSDLAQQTEALLKQLHDYPITPPGAAATPAAPPPAAVKPAEPAAAEPVANATEQPAPVSTPADKPDDSHAATPTPAPSAEIPPTSGLDRLRQRFMRDSGENINNMLLALEQLDNADSAQQAAADLLKHSQHLVNGAAAVEFMAVSEFAQMFSNVVKKLEAGKITNIDGFSKLATSSCNHLTDLINQTIERNGLFEEEVEHTRQSLLEQLREYLSSAQAQQQKLNMPVHQPTPVVIANDVQADHLVAAANWHISLRFHDDALQAGVEPLASLRYLNTSGQIVSLYTLFDTMPDAAEMDPEHCYLGFEIEYKTDADKEAIEAMFELVQEHCQIRILPPHSKLSHYIDLIEELPEDTLRLGEILLQTGTLTDRELQAGLNQQNAKLLGSAAVDERPKIGEILVETGVVHQDIVNAALNKQRQSKEKETKTASRLQKNLNVDAEKLDQLINLVGELVIANASVNLLMQEVSHDRLKEAASLMSRLVEDIRNSTLRMRMVHIGGTFNRFRRLVHDISHDLNKQIDLVITGAEAELDKSMVEKINDPLMHLIRNAIDHGIESAEQRAAAGKPATGTLTLNAYHDSGSIVIEVSDDGAGLNRDKILSAAIAKGIVKADQDLNEKDIDSLIFESSLSTSASVTQLSGRGVGLDVVKRNINALNGMVDVISEEGEGTTFQIFLPLTLAIIDGFLLNVSDSSFVVPLDRVVECVQLSEVSNEAHDTGYLNLRGKVLPLLYMHKLFGIPAKQNQRENIIVVRYGNQEAGLVVDELLGEFQAVIKPLGKIFEKLSGVSGATILGNGEVALILDIPGLVQKYAGNTSTSAEHHRRHVVHDEVSG